MARVRVAAAQLIDPGGPDSATGRSALRRPPSSGSPRRHRRILLRRCGGRIGRHCAFAVQDRHDIPLRVGRCGWHLRSGMSSIPEYPHRTPVRRGRRARFCARRHDQGAEIGQHHIAATHGGHSRWLAASDGISVRRLRKLDHRRKRWHLEPLSRRPWQRATSTPSKGKQTGVACRHHGGSAASHGWSSLIPRVASTGGAKVRPPSSVRHTVVGVGAHVSAAVGVEAHRGGGGRPTSPGARRGCARSHCRRTTRTRRSGRWRA
jgi:hypothetical protein